MQGYVNIKEASQITGKHTDTIRRLINQNKGSKFIAKDSKGRIMVETGWITSHFDSLEAPVSPEKNKDDPQVVQTDTSATQPVIEALTKQLEAKDKQISELLSAINAKEANTTKLQDQFQQLLARQLLPAGQQNTASQAQPEPFNTAYAEPMQTDTKEPKQTQKTKPKRAKPAKTSKPVVTKTKKRWWQKNK